MEAHMTEGMTAGIKQTLRMLERGMLSEIMIAGDADHFVVRPAVQMAEFRNVKITYIDTKRNLGRMCGLDTGTAVAGVLREKP
jgi:large subunit ribosomal protein L7A